MGTTDQTDSWLSEIGLSTIRSMFLDNGVKEILYKVLPKNANSKNQVYLGGSDLAQFGKIPSGELTLHYSASRKNGKKEAVYRAALEFYWLDQNGQPVRAPQAKIILYPQYPEVRFSGFLKGCKNPPSSLWAKDKRGQEPGRILVLGVGNGTKIFGITLPPESPASNEIRASGPHDTYGVFNILPLNNKDKSDGFNQLVAALCGIHRRSWVPSTRLDPTGRLIPCNASNCNGNTLESLLGIRSNGYSEPDFMGWEVKARQVPDVERPSTSVVTLFTPEPTSGVYADKGVREFVSRYGYSDTKGRSDRSNFGGIYRANMPAHDRTGLRLLLDGFDAETREYSPSGSVQLVDAKNNIAAAWPFVKLMDHWKVKHARAAFVPAQQRLDPERQYRYGRNILVGEGAEFALLLLAIHEGKVYYDPGIKVEGVSTSSPKSKKRSQFRVSSKDLSTLYVSTRIVDVCD